MPTDLCAVCSGMGLCIAWKRLGEAHRVRVVGRVMLGYDGKGTGHGLVTAAQTHFDTEPECFIPPVNHSVPDIPGFKSSMTL